MRNRWGVWYLSLKICAISIEHIPWWWHILCNNTVNNTTASTWGDCPHYSRQHLTFEAHWDLWSCLQEMDAVHRVSINEIHFFLQQKPVVGYPLFWWSDTVNFQVETLDQRRTIQHTCTHAVHHNIDGLLTTSPRFSQYQQYVKVFWYCYQQEVTESASFAK